MQLRELTMARLPESKETLEAIKEKALKYTIQNGTFMKPSVFRPGKAVTTFSEMCARVNRRSFL